MIDSPAILSPIHLMVTGLNKYVASSAACIGQYIFLAAFHQIYGREIESTVIYFFFFPQMHLFHKMIRSVGKKKNESFFSYSVWNVSGTSGREVNQEKDGIQLRKK